MTMTKAFERNDKCLIINHENYSLFQKRIWCMTIYESILTEKYEENKMFQILKRRIKVEKLDSIDMATK